MIEGIIQLYGVEGLGVEFQPVGFRQVLRVKAARPVPVMPAGSADTDLHSVFPHINILAESIASA